ncbi:MAG: hypothetical protein PHY30_03000 [Candidatus Pacebacteria bacterium]|nr:hypothetical protein [Candidatus Paceibacterota bacterium]
MKKSLKIHYFLAWEGYTEYKIFSYLTRNRFRGQFLKSDIRFRDAINITQGEIIISNGKLNGVGDKTNFKSKYLILKKYYPDETFFFFLDEDLYDSSEIEQMIKMGGDFVQFIKYNSEYLLLKLSNFNLKNPEDFDRLEDFRQYCKDEFYERFRKKASEMKEAELEQIFKKISEDEIKDIFNELFLIAGI